MLDARRRLPTAFAVAAATFAVLTASDVGWSQQDALNWRVTVLTPAGLAPATAGRDAWGSGPGQQVGWIDFQAALWKGTAGSYVNLSPAGSGLSWAQGSDGSAQVGMAAVSDGSVAAMWHGTAASFENLNPPGWAQSEFLGIGGGQQVGDAWNDYLDTSPYYPASRAGIWRGTAESFASIHPAGYDRSVASATDGIHQVGMAAIGDVRYAGMWSGSSDSFVNLSPDGTWSEAGDVAGDEQVGSIDGRAVLWHDTAQSVQYLLPTGIGMSQCFATIGGYEVGWVYQGFGSSYAIFWAGSAETAINLQNFLPPEYVSSSASGIARVGDELQVAGTATRHDGTVDAVLWTATIPEPQALTSSLAGFALSLRPARRLLHRI
jgi:hypothetical protein